jgi:transcription attenuation protein (tryptophan RNA-binding attenuator protein)
MTRWFYLDGNLDKVLGDYIVIRAEENGVNIIGLTRGRDTKFHHTEKLDKGEVLIAQFTENTSAIKIRGNAKIICRHGEIQSGE